METREKRSISDKSPERIKPLGVCFVRRSRSMKSMSDGAVFLLATVYLTQVCRISAEIPGKLTSPHEARMAGNSFPSKRPALRELFNSVLKRNLLQADDSPDMFATHNPKLGVSLMIDGDSSGLTRLDFYWKADAKLKITWHCRSTCWAY
jgi:hypothetical protein